MPVPDAKRFEPIGLKREQFGLVACVVFLAVAITSLLTWPAPTHIITIPIGIAAPAPGFKPLVLEVAADNSITVNTVPVTLAHVARLATKMKATSRTVVLKPNVCAPHDTVLRVIAVLKRSNAPFALAPPNFATAFGRRTKRLSESYPQIWDSTSALSHAESGRLETNFLTSVRLFDDDCRRKFDPDYKPEATVI